MVPCEPMCVGDKLEFSNECLSEIPGSKLDSCIGGDGDGGVYLLVLLVAKRGVVT